MNLTTLFTIWAGVCFLLLLGFSFVGKTREEALTAILLMTLGYIIGVCVMENEHK